MKRWIVTHTNFSDEKFYYKVQAETRKAAKQAIVEKEHVYECTLTAVASEEAEIFTFTGHTPIVVWNFYKR